VTSRPRYDEASDFYATMYGDSVSDPATAALLDLVGDVGGKRVLDIACGHGRVARALARRGADVVGVDVSSVMLGVARRIENSDPLGISYRNIDVTSRSPMPDTPYDIVTCSYGLTDIDDLDAVLHTVGSSILPDGLFVFSIMHPCFPGWGSDVSASWPTNGNYFDEGWWRSTASSSRLRQRVGANHRTISTYVNALSRVGLLLETVREPVPPEEWIGDPVPMNFIARCRRMPAPAADR
jgi:2-polyprenyl-3-methyl-5-hydroxy-6-metoxy-1,4-benzoquinol methylase